MTNHSSIEFTNLEPAVRQLCSAARTAWEQGQRLEAERLYVRSIRLLEETGESAQIAKLRIWALGQLAEIRRQHGLYQEAEPLLREALSIAERVFGPEDLEVSTTAN